MAGPMLRMVVPAYNEGEHLRDVIGEWVDMLRGEGISFHIALYDDGSTDGTGTVADGLAQTFPEVIVVHKENSGHGATCLLGYRDALRSDAQWILQIDGDGQCEAEAFPAVWSQRTSSPAVYGERRTRGDGWKRWCVSRCLKIIILFSTWLAIPDANVPYRLMRRDCLDRTLRDFPGTCHSSLVNALVAVVQSARGEIHWVPMGFRARHDGRGRIRTSFFVREGALLVRDLLLLRKAIRQR